ncbi:MAG: acyltransferase [Chlorobia bacterium]|nr:acyltransferase [Fimbriimonadaceae bacterium]
MGSQTCEGSGSPGRKVPSRRSDFIDAIRGLAVLGVIAVHVGQKMPAPWFWLKQLMDAGQYGVQLFFLASAVTLYNSHEHRSQEQGATAKYLIRRFFRIAPIYYLAILFYYAYFNAQELKIGIEVPVANFLFVHSLFPTTINVAPPGGWSIGVEMLFYLILLWVFRWVHNLKSAAALLAATILLALGARLITGNIRGEDHLMGEFFHYYLPNQLYVFAIGICAYFIVKVPLNRDEPAKPALGWMAFLISSILCLFVLSLVRTSSILFEIPFAVCLAGLVVSLANWRPNVLVNPVTCLLGKLSFSIYLVHFVMLDLSVGLFKRFGVADGIFGTLSLFAVVTLLTVAVAAVTKRWIEDPGIDLGRRFIRQMDSKREVNPAL